MSDDKNLSKRLRDLDPQALSSIHQTFYPDIVRYATYRLSDVMIAEDLASDTFIHLIDAISQGKGPTKNVRGWLLGTVNNLINDYYRTVYKQDQRNTGDSGAGFVDPVSQIDGQLDAHDQLSTALTALTNDQQMVISLRFGAELTLAETAAAMGKKPNAIKALQFRALAALRQRLEMAPDG